MATQHPDNATTPYWGRSPFISTLDEVEECYRAFSEIGCDEYMWDWEGKFVDEAVVDRLFNRHETYFRNWENLKFLARSDPGWETVRNDVLFLEEYLGKRLGPKTADHFIHRNLTSNIYHLWRQGKKEVREEILRAARVRRSLG